MRRTGTVLGTGVVLAALLAALAVAQWAGRDRATFGPGSLEAVERAVAAAGLRTCDAADVARDLPGGSLGGRAYTLAASCPGDAVTVVVDRFASAGDRDAAARRFESLSRPRGSGWVLTLADATVLLRGPGDEEPRRRLRVALIGEGAR
ncbi:hypothetical protein JD79_02845 [Geodermatophilus normandii]|uniref:Uncharacterized protein n=1 Tax=Geodermatophilus normandii TaxID=1137989 RepID=A0A317QPV9_9ACTN|nr:hypothetical protein JD79_02845 [Geodermatophilus normandii]